jgi:predicted  nucleic acid-binding Zn-ribbon protein
MNSKEINIMLSEYKRDVTRVEEKIIKVEEEIKKLEGQIEVVERQRSTFDDPSERQYLAQKEDSFRRGSVSSNPGVNV